ncbi:hypothetical protein ASA1KI_21160 [Opitutales bacterium ASA1]|nr:hypothetical protein ASA1KI_21160 [Opitutales bacterium ASA1]
MKRGSAASWLNTTLGVCGLIGALFGAYSWYTAPRHDLVAEIGGGALELPMDFRTESDRHFETAIEALSLAIAATDKIEPYVAQGLKERFAAEARFRLRELSSQAGRFNGLWRITVHNRGDLPVEDVAMTAPGALAARIVKQGVTTTEEIRGGVIPIGSIRPLESVVITAWSFTEPSRFDFERASVTHRHGLGSTEFRDSTSGFGFAEIMLIGVPVGAVAVCLLLVAVSLGGEKGQKTSENEQEPRPSPPPS